MPFWGLLGKFAGAEKGHAFWSKTVDFYAILGFLGKAAAWKKGLERKKRKLLFNGRGELGLSSANGGVFLVSERLRPFLGPCWTTKIPNTKRKVLGIFVWAF